jgi:thioredoxin 1
MTDSRVLVVDDTNFEALVLASKEPVLLDFTAAWCGPCKVIAPILETLAHEHAGTFKVAKIDIDASPATAIRFGIRGAPTLVAIRDGQEVRRRIGAGSKSTLLALMG